MNKIKPYLKFVPYVIIVALVVIIILMDKCATRRETSQLADITKYKDTAMTYRAENGDLVAYNTALELSNREQMNIVAEKNKQLSALMKDFKKIELALSVKQEIRIEHDTIRFTDSIPCDFNPICVEDTNEWYDFNVTVTPTYFTLNRLTTFNEQSFVLGSKKVGFFKPLERRVEVVNSNPYMITKNISAFVIDDKKRWFETRAFSVVVGFVSGVVVGNRMAK